MRAVRSLIHGLLVLSLLAGCSPKEAAVVPEISVESIATTETNELREVEIDFVLSSAIQKQINLLVFTVDGTAIADEDYVSLDTMLMIPANTESFKLKLEIIGDYIHEDTELFFLEFSMPVNATLANNSTSITIFDDDERQTRLVKRSGGDGDAVKFPLP